VIARAIAVVIAAVTVLFCLPAILLGAVWLDSVSASRDFSQSVTFPAGGSLDIDAPGAGVDLVAGPAGAVTLTEKVSVRALTPDLARRALDSVPRNSLAATEHGASLRLGGNGFQPLTAIGFSHDLEVTLPADAAVSIRGTAGAVDARGLRGDLNIQLTAGAIQLRQMDVPHSVVVRTTAGAIEFQGSVESDAVLDLETVNGAIDVRVPRGSDARYDASTVNGAVQVDGQGGSGRHATSASGVLGGSGSALITLRTTNGAIHLGPGPAA
jgi:hypothetical protein